MKLTRLELSQVRGFKEAEFTFHPDMNLLVGANGAGKSTVLDVLRILLSKIIDEITISKEKALRFENDHIKINGDRLYAMVQFSIGNDFVEEYEVRKWYEDDKNPQEDRKTVSRLSPSSEKLSAIGKSDEIADFLQRRHRYLESLKNSFEQVLAVYYSPHRSILEPRRSSTGGQAAAFAMALAKDRGIQLRDFAQWWRTREVLAREGDDRSSHQLLTLRRAAEIFLEHYRNLRVANESLTFLLDKGEDTLSVEQLSDGERSILFLVLDLAMRLATANPKLRDPIQDGQAVVLIDELDLHLHPRWQRDIVGKLIHTFPNCQFIATTHSPQILGEVPPEQIILIEHGNVFKPNQSLGMDTNWILQFLMGTAPRPEETQQQLEQIAEMIDEEAFDEAENGIDKLRNELGDFPDLVKLQTRLDRMRILGI